MPKGSEKQKIKIRPHMENGSYQLTSTGPSANHGMMGRHWLAGNSHFPRERIFIFCFSEPLGINIEILNALLLWQPLFIQIYFGKVCLITEDTA